MSTPIDVVINALDHLGYKVQRRGSTYVCRCPAHGDRNPSLHIREGDTQPVVLHCMAGCATPEILSAIGLSWATICKGQSKSSTTLHVICDEYGEPVAIHKRIGTGSKKKMPWFGTDGSRGLNGRKKADLPLYGCEYLALREDEPVVIVEGEKAQEAISAQGILAVATVTGSASIPCDDSLRVLAGRVVVLWPDACEDGRSHMERLGRRLLDVAREVRWFSWEDSPPGGDAADWAGTNAELRKALDGSSVWTGPLDWPSPEEAAEGCKWDGVFGTNDRANALRIQRFLGHRVRWARGFGWCLWDGRRYEVLADEHVRVLASDVLLRAARDLLPWAEKKAAEMEENEAARFLKPFHAAVSNAGNVRCIEQALKMARGLRGIHVAAEDFDNQESYGHLLNLANGVLDLDKSVLHPHAPDRLFTSVSRIRWNPNAPCPRWRRFWIECMFGDRGKMLLLQEFAGYALTARRPYEIGFIFIGMNGSGKGTFLGAIVDILGSFAHESLAGIFQGKTGGHSEALANLHGKRLLHIREIDQGKLSVDVMKQVLEGAEFNVSHKCEKEFRLKCSALVAMSGNTFPRIGGDAGIADRLVQIDFLREHTRNPATMHEGVERADPTLKARLRSEREGILAWAVRGLQRLTGRGGFKVPSSVRVSTEDFLEGEEAPIAAFLQECVCRGEDGDLLPLKEVIRAWLRWSGEDMQKLEDNTYLSWFWSKVRELAKTNGQVRRSLGLKQGEVLPPPSQSRKIDGRRYLSTYRLSEAGFDVLGAPR